MKLFGLQKMTLLDFPGKVACTVFTGGCNMRCPFCHNASLVTELDPGDVMEEEMFFRFLRNRKGLLDGVCITGGEPCMQKDLASFITRVRAEGFSVKLDTNGTCPEVLNSLIEQGLLDYVAMDVKNAKEKYAATVGIPDFDLSAVEKSVKILLEGRVPYEFRTTVVEEFHTIPDIASIAEWIRGAEAYHLQAFTDSGNLIGEGLHAASRTTMQSMLDAAREHVENVSLRGI